MSSTCTCMVHLSLQRFRCSCTCTCTLLHNSCIQTCTYCIHQSCEAAHDPIYLLVFQSQKLSGAYADYCAHLVVAKHVLESKKQERQLQDFLQVLATAACCDKTTCDCHHHNDIVVITHFRGAWILSSPEDLIFGHSLVCLLYILYMYIYSAGVHVLYM